MDTKRAAKKLQGILGNALERYPGSTALETCPFCAAIIDGRRKERAGMNEQHADLLFLP
jgi:hypothetical protein